jgi:DNA-binding LacI/PurR family transcriptional regulator
MSTNTPQSSIVIIAGTDASGGFSISSRNERLLQTIERECYGRNVHRRLCAYLESGTDRRLYDSATGIDIDLPSCGDILGFIVLTEVMTDTHWIIDRISSLGKPLVVFDETGKASIPNECTFNNRIAHFKVGFTPTAAHAMARYLFRLGHRRIAYLSYCHWEPWSVARCNGLIEAFKELGVHDAVVPYGISTYISHWDYGSAYTASSLPPELIPIKRLQGYIDSAAHSIPHSVFHFFDPLKSIPPNMRRIEGEWNTMLPLFEQALADDRITAWVACSDDLAYKALHFLKSRNIRVPETISLAGFDDLPESFDLNLTTYNFNPDGIAYQMLSFIFQAPQPGTSGGICSFEINGNVLERATTGLPRVPQSGIPSQPAPATGIRRSILIVSGPDVNGNFYRDMRKRPLFQSLEQECAGRDIGIMLGICSSAMGEPILVDARTRERINLANQTGVIGIVVLAELIPNCTPLLRMVGNTGIPVAVIDDSGVVVVPPGLRSPVSYMPLGFTASCARTVAKYLLRLGHPRIAYLSALHPVQWSKTRLCGLTEIFAEHGLRDQVVLFANEDLIDFYHYYNHTLDAHCPVQPHIQQLKNFVAFFESLQGEFSPRISGLALQGRQYVVSMCLSEFVGQIMEPFFKKALADNTITAWVCSADGVAYRALEFLNQRGIDVPGKLSVVGFDDLPESFKYNLTTFNFNLVGMAYKIMSFFHEPKLPHAPSNEPSISEVEGIIIERSTTGPPPGRT